MSNTLYLECYSGISGDMTVGALLDLGADETRLLETLKSLDIDGYQIAVSRKKKAGLDTCKFDVILLEEGHCHEEGHAHEEGHCHGEGHSQEKHCHEAGHTHGENHAHIHRNLYDVYEILDRLADQKVKVLAKRMFAIVAEAESKAHGLPIEKVHFHEVGAVDSIIDIVSAAFCIVDLQIEKVFVSDLYEGRGHVKCQHGILPVPVPATLNIAQHYQLKIHMTEEEGEMVTPTGAAIAAALKSDEKFPQNMTVIKTGLGAGTKEFKRANILRAMLIETKEEKMEEPVWILQTNLDDCTGEALAFTMEQLLKEGARDVFYTPVYMKKNRPAYLLEVLCDEKERKTLENIIFRNTTTIGIRRLKALRTVLEREKRKVECSYGIADVKVCKEGTMVRYYPEYESVKKLCESQGADYQSVYSDIVECARRKL